MADAAPRLRRSLRTLNLTLFGLIAIAPIAAITIHGFVAEKSKGAILPAYLLAGLGVGLTALSFAQMAEAAPSAGSVHGYVGKAMGQTLGFLGAWAILIDYLLVNTLVIAFGALYLCGAFPALSVQATALCFAAYAFALGSLGVAWSARADMLVAGIQALMVLMVVVLGAAILLQGDGAAASPPAFWPPSANLGTAVAGASVAVIAYLGFDAISTLAEEVDDDQVGRVIGRATLLTVVLMTGVFLAVGWTLGGLAGGLAPLAPDDAGLQIVAAHLPQLLLPLGIVSGLALGLGVNLATVTGAARILFSLARTGHLPAGLAAIHPRFGSPWKAVLLVFVLCAAGSLVALDHVDLLSGLVSFGALTAFLLVNLSVIVHYGLEGHSQKWLSHWILPGAGSAVVAYIMFGIGSQALKLGLIWLVAGLAVSTLTQLITRRRAGLSGDDSVP